MNFNPLLKREESIAKKIVPLIKNGIKRIIL